MKPAPFRYHRPTDLEQTLDLLAELGPDAKILAGGQSLVPVLNMRLATPAHLIDINHLPDLDHVRVTEDAVVVGALVRHTQLLQDEAAASAQPLIGQALAHVAHPVIRNRGTTVGSLAHADPSGEMPAILALTGGSVLLRSASGERTLGAEEFFVGPMESAIAAEEIALEARFGLAAPGTRTAYTATTRRHGDYALAGVGLVVRLEQDRVQEARASFVSLTEVPDVLDLTPALDGATAADLPDRLAAVTEAVGAHVDPVDDIHASADYRRHLGVIQTHRLLTELLGATTQEPEEASA